MRASRNATDSLCSGVTIVDVSDFDPGIPFEDFEIGTIRPLEPHTVFLKVPATDVASIRVLETLGFRYCETQIALSWSLEPLEDPDREGQYRFVSASSRRQREAALALASSIFSHDRFSTDPEFGPEVSARRYRMLLEQSLTAGQDAVFVMEEVATGQVVSFASIRRAGAEARLLIGGVSREFHGSGLGAVHDIKGLNHYRAIGIRRLKTAVSAINYPVMNLEIAHLGFRVRSSAIVMRKRYTGTGACA